MFRHTSCFLLLYTNDIPKTHDFYKQIGLEIKEFASDKVVVAVSDLELHFILSSTEPQEKYKYITQLDHAGQGIILYIETENIFDFQELITKIGGKIKAPIYDNHWGCKEFLFEDPNGYKLALYEQ